MLSIKSFNNYSGLVIILVVFIVLFQGIKLKRYMRNEIVKSDAVSYYAYLPAAVIYHDLSFRFTGELPENFDGVIWTHTSPNGKETLKMSMGLAFLLLPFFLIAHILALLSTFPADGYSAIYQFFILIAAVFYLLAGLLFLRKVLKQFFEDRVVAISLTMVVMATNLYYYTVAEPGMSHVFSFFLFNAFLFYLLKWNELPRWKNSFLFALFAGLIILVRPANILIMVLPVLYWNRRGFGKQLAWLWKQRIMILFMLVLAFLVILPQLIYWKYSTGSWIYYSYGEEGFYFNNPHIFDGLFTYRKGWFVYTPIMLFFVVGLFFMRKRIPELFIPLSVFLLLNIYVVFSWWCWWYGGSFGARPMIDSYGLLALPFAVLIEKVIKQKIWIKIPVGLLLIFFIYLNLFQSRQYRITMIHWDSMTKQAYWKVFLREQWPENYEKLINPPDYAKALKGENED
ncbi:MAG: hypothetical protein J7L04_01350 [Bacteroidales bacterium]|nr:hypothetical protein [Bacteroidales bacterium]